MNADISVLGLGTMGGRVAARAAQDAGLSVAGYDPAAPAAEQARSAGVHTMTARQCAAASAIVLLSVPKPEHVTELATTALTEARPGTVVVDLSTIDPGTARAAARELATHDITYLDAPVLGRPERVGQWTLAVGGPHEKVDEVTPLLLSVAAAHVVRVGDTGAGSVVKLLNNLVFGAINAVTAEALALCRDNHVDPDLFVRTVADSGAATVSNLFRDLAPRIVAGNDEPVFAMNLLAKDNRLVVQLASESGTRAPVAAMVNEVNERTLALGLGHRDSAAVYQTYTHTAQ